VNESELLLVRPLVQESAPRLVQVLVPPLDLRKEKGLDPQSEMMLGLG
jgi:hypothetical protein